MIAKFFSLFADIPIPGTDELSSPSPSSSHMQPALVGVAVLAVGVIAFLGIDFYRQKRTERKEREKLARFRDKRLREVADATSAGRDDRYVPSLPGKIGGTRAGTDTGRK